MKGNTRAGSPCMSSLEDVMGEDAKFKAALEMTGECGECEGHWTAAAGDGDTVLHSLSCHIMYYIMFVLRFVLFFTNSKND